MGWCLRFGGHTATRTRRIVWSSSCHWGALACCSHFGLVQLLFAASLLLFLQIRWCQLLRWWYWTLNILFEDIRARSSGLRLLFFLHLTAIWRHIVSSLFPARTHWLSVVFRPAVASLCKRLDYLHLLLRSQCCFIFPHLLLNYFGKLIHLLLLMQWLLRVKQHVAVVDICIRIVRVVYWRGLSKIDAVFRITLLLRSILKLQLLKQSLHALLC